MLPNLKFVTKIAIFTGDHVHTHPHTHEHVHADGTVHSHEHTHTGDHAHEHSCDGQCGGCASQCEHTPMEELLALMKYMIGHNAAHVKELADLAVQLEQAGSHDAYEQVMAAVSDFEKGNLRLSAILSSLNIL